MAVLCASTAALRRVSASVDEVQDGGGLYVFVEMMFDVMDTLVGLNPEYADYLKQNK